MTTQGFYKTCLEDELARRCERNPRYSLRAFSKALGINVATLSLILAGKRIPSYKAARKIALGMDLSPERESHFMASVARAQRAVGLKRISPQMRKVIDEAPQRELSVDLFRTIADWYHFAILELTFVENFHADSRWIARRLGISIMEASLSLQRLKDLELLVEKNGRLAKSEENITTADRQVTTAALRRHQKQIMEKAAISLEEDPIEQRQMLSTTMSVDPEKIPEAKRRIEKFHQEICEFLNTGNRTEVYALGTSLFPLSRISPKDQEETGK